MNLTLWLLNRCVSWEQDHPGAMVSCLVRAGHDVTLGQRCVGAPPESALPAGDRAPRVSRVAVNEGIDSPPGALMHEGAPDDRPSYDEYFVPIALKCIGDAADPSKGNDAAAFWARTRASDDGRAAILAKLFDPLVNPCFEPDECARYWHVSPETHRSARTPTPTWPFADVRMNTVGGRGYYEILAEHTKTTGRKNVLVGYSQGGTVASFLAYLDQEVYSGERCIYGVVSVQGALQGSPLALTANAEWIAHALTTLLLSLLPRSPDTGGGAAAALGTNSAESARRAVERVAEQARQGRGAGHLTPEGQTVFAALATLLDAIVNANARDRDRRWLIDVLRTTRKWISGLTGRDGLAFRDLDPTRLDEPGSVLHAIASTTFGMWHGAVVGTDYRLEEFVRGLLDQNWATDLLEHLFRAGLTHYLQRAQDVYRAEVMDVAGDGRATLAPRLQQFRDQWASGAGGKVDERAHDFIIPSVSQLFPQEGPLFLGNRVNADASHLSGARLDTRPSDLELACQLLQKMVVR